MGKLMLIPEELIIQTDAERIAGVARIAAVGTGRPGIIIGPFEVIDGL